MTAPDRAALERRAEAAALALGRARAELAYAHDVIGETSAIVDCEAAFVAASNEWAEARHQLSEAQKNDA